MLALKLNIYLLDESSEVEFYMFSIKDSHTASQKVVTTVTRLVPDLNDTESSKLTEIATQIEEGTRLIRTSNLSNRVALRLSIRKDN